MRDEQNEQPKTVECVVPIKIKYWKVNYCPKEGDVITKIKNNTKNKLPLIWDKKTD